MHDTRKHENRLRIGAGAPDLGVNVTGVSQAKDPILDQGVTEQVRVRVVKKRGTRHGNEK